jgi:hypothetical protein
MNTIFGMPVAAVINQAQNLALVAFGFFVSRGYLSSDQLGTLVSAGGIILTMIANGFTHAAPGASFTTTVSKPNGVSTGG